LVEIVQQLVSFILHFDRHLDTIIRAYGTWTYALLFLIIFCETGLVVTPFLPGDSLLFAAGAIASRGSLDPGWLSLALAVAAVAGDAANYWIGRLAGDRLTRGRFRRYIRQDYLDRTHTFYERHGAKTIVLARFVPIIRTFAPFVAGLGQMGYRKFSAYNVLGGIAWILIFVLGGFFFGNLPVVRQHFSLVVAGVIVVSFLPVAVELWRARAGRA
jgi:membrane-associated protein